MKPIEFEGHNIVFAKDQPQYLPLPAHLDTNGTVTTCWELTPEERIEVFNNGKIWLRQRTFNQPLQPVNMFSDSPFDPELLCVSFLMGVHPDLDKFQAADLLKFCREHTIYHIQCYGDGSIMYPKWKESKL